MLRIMRTTSECLVKAAEMDRLSDACPVAAIAAEYESFAAYWRGLARLAANTDESSLVEAALGKWIGQPSIH